MAVIVRHIQNNADYVLLGTGFGAYRSAHPSALLGNWSITKDQGTLPMVAVCDYEGRIGWISSTKLQVVSIDGMTPDEALEKHPAPSERAEETTDSD